MPKKAKTAGEAPTDEIEAFDVVLPGNVAAKDDSGDAMLKKLECED